MSSAARITALVCLILLLGGAGTSAASAPSEPSDAAEHIRTALLAAQLSLGNGQSAEARAALDSATGEYERVLAVEMHARTPGWERRARDALDQARRAVGAGDLLAFAVARASAWTALLGGGMEITIGALEQQDAAVGERWLHLREFRRATTLSRPEADATLAVAGALAGSTHPHDAAGVVRAELLDTYQARLSDTLYALIDADRHGFPTRRAELAASADGYFATLASAYADQRGREATDRLMTHFAALVGAARAGRLDARALGEINAALQRFRAAPPSPRALQRRAAQLMRFLSLVPVEYARGVRGGRVTIDLEVQEAVAFHRAARDAFDDLRAVLEERDHELVSSVAGRLDTLGVHLRAARDGDAVAPPRAIRSATEQAEVALRRLLPEAWLRRDNVADLDVIATSLDQMEAAVSAGRYDVAESARLEAYAVLETGPEARLRAFAPHLVGPIEEAFWYGGGRRGLAALLARRAGLSEVRTGRAALDRLLEAARDVGGGPASPPIVITNAAIIVFREGLEAVLILASLLGSLRRPAWKPLRRPLWLGAAAACAAASATWILARGALLAMARFGERLEAAMSLLAVAVLLLITNWFFHDVYWTDWLASFHQRKTRLLRLGIGQGLGLFSLGFASVYREGFEVVIFLQALALEVGERVVAAGVLAGVAATALVGIVLFRLHARLPYRRMLVVTGVLIGVVLLQMIGRTVRTMQIVGWLPVHAVAGVTVPHWMGLWFGVFGTWDGVLGQVAAAAFALGSYQFAGRLERGRRRQRSSRGPQESAANCRRRLPLYWTQRE
jgi:high-affinity iron transporter